MKTHAIFNPLIWCVGLLLVNATPLPAQPGDASAKLINVSARVGVSADTPTPIVGFVAGETTEQGASQWFLIRVIGPSLGGLGVPRPLARPAALLYGQHAAATRLGYEYRAFAQIVYPDGTTPASLFREALRAAAAASGAFPVPIPDVNEPLPEDRDVVDLVELRPGVYTVHATAREAGGTGEVLVEVYALPANFSPRLEP